MIRDVRRDGAASAKRSGLASRGTRHAEFLERSFLLRLMAKSLLMLKVWVLMCSPWLLSKLQWPAKNPLRFRADSRARIRLAFRVTIRSTHSKHKRLCNSTAMDDALSGSSSGVQDRVSAATTTRRRAPKDDDAAHRTSSADTLKADARQEQQHSVRSAPLGKTPDGTGTFASVAALRLSLFHGAQATSATGD